MTFDELNLCEPLRRAVAEAGYETPSPIQAKAIPPVMAGNDLLGCAQTGTGKTAAFALPMLQNLSATRPAGKKIRALILTPTRELALQIGQSFSDYGKYLKIRHTVIFGGVGQQPQVDALRRGVEIVIACPGRLNDLINQGHVDLSGVEIFVLDEADRMLDMGFVHDVKKVIAKLPTKRQTLLFSATMPREIENLADSMLKSPVSVKVDPVSSTVDRIDQRLYIVSKANKKDLLIWLLKDKSILNALIFSRTKHGADKIARELNKAGIAAAAIHGNKSQSARVTALEDFKAGKTRVLVATDIAARGIDINELSHVFNYDLPEVPETYVHRIGRTARAGADGVAISFCCPDENEYLAGIEKLNRKKIPVVHENPWEGMAQLPPPPKPPQPVRGRRPAAGETPAEKTGRSAKPARAAESKTDRSAQHRGTAIASGKAPGRQNNAKKNEIFGTDAKADEPETVKMERDSVDNENNRPLVAAGWGRPAAPANEGRNDRPRQNQRPRREEAPRQAVAVQKGEGQELSPSAKRRRRRRRAQGGSGDTALNERQQTARPERAPGNEAQGSPRRAVQETQPQQRRNEPTRTPQQADLRENGRGSRRSRSSRSEAPAANRPRTERSAQPARQPASPPARKEDPGLLLISRKPPVQKFASFEDYMSARGGETAPIVGEDEKQ